MVTFESLHEDGAKKYGALWLRANQSVIELAMYYDLDYVKHKQALSHIVKWVLDEATKPEPNLEGQEAGDEDAID